MQKAKAVIEYAKTQPGFVVIFNEKNHFFDNYKGSSGVEGFIQELSEEGCLESVDNKTAHN